MSDQPYPYAFFEGKVTKIEDAKISIMTNALQYGTAFFGGIRAYYNKDEDVAYIFRLDDHYERFLRSANVIGCALPYTKEELKKITIDLVEKNKLKGNAYIRPFAYMGNTRLAPKMDDPEMAFSLHMISLDDYLPTDRGLDMKISTWRRVSDNAIPPRAKISGAYINSGLARREANSEGFDDAIILNENGSVCEASAANIFIVRDGTLITPAKTDNILEGIVRRSVIELAKEMNIPTEERSIGRTELYIADEVLVSGTGYQVGWISSVDKRIINDGKIGPVTTKLQKKFFEVVRGIDKSHEDWLTKVTVK